MFKRIKCVILCAMLAMMSVVSLAAQAPHIHSGVLLSLRTEAGLSVARCGVFRCTKCGATYAASVDFDDVGIPVV